MNNWFKVFSIFFILGLAVYFNSLNNKFLIDDYVFLNNPVMSSPKFILSQWNPFREQALGVLDKHERLEYFRPMALMLYDFCYSTFKAHFWLYHLLNLFLFVLASSLIYLLIRKVTGNYDLAFLTGLFYLIHPINGIIVNYISASVFAFQVICTLGSILLLWESLERENNRALYVLSLMLSFLSLFWNESGIMTPFYLCSFILIFRKESLKNKVVIIFPYFLIIFSYIVFRLFFISINEILFKKLLLYHMTGWEHLAALFQILVWYISKLFYPLGVVMQWATPILHDHIIGHVLGLCLLLMLFLLLVVKFAKEKTCQWALAWAFIGFVPVYWAGFRVPDNGAQIEPHWFVVSSIGFFILAAYCSLIVLERTKKTGMVLLFSLILAWGSISHANNRLWADQKTYALYWAQENPHLKSTYFYIADACQREGDFKESQKYYRLALAGIPSDMEIYNNLGIMDAQEGDWKGAESNYRKVLKIHPLSAATYNNLGELYFRRGQWDKAKENYDRSLALDPLLIAPRIGLAAFFLRQGEYLKAIDYSIKAIRLAPDNSEAYLIAGLILANLGKYDEAVNIWNIGSSIALSDQRFKINITKALELKSRK